MSASAPRPPLLLVAGDTVIVLQPIAAALKALDQLWLRQLGAPPPPVALSHVHAHRSERASSVRKLDDTQIKFFVLLFVDRI